MIEKTSSSLKEIARSLRVEDRDYPRLRNAFLEYVDKRTGSRYATLNLDDNKLAQHQEAFIAEPIAAKYATILEGLNLPNSQVYNNTILAFQKLTSGWRNNLKKTKSHRTTVSTPQVSNHGSITIDLEEEEDTSHLLWSGLEVQSPSAGRFEAGGSNIAPASARDETVRPDTPEIATATDEDTIHPGLSMNQLQNRTFSPSNQLRLESTEISHAGPSNTKRRYDQIESDEQRPEDPEEQTDDEQAERQRQDVSRARAGKRVRRDEPESPFVLHSETPARTPVVLDIYESARRPPIPPPHRSSPSTDELKAWLNLFLLTIRERQRFVGESAEAANLGVGEKRFLEFVLKTFSDLDSDLQEIASRISPRLA